MQRSRQIIDLNARDIHGRTPFMKAWHRWDILAIFLHYEENVLYLFFYFFVTEVLFLKGFNLEKISRKMKSTAWRRTIFHFREKKGEGKGSKGSNIEYLSCNTTPHE